MNQPSSESTVEPTLRSAGRLVSIYAAFASLWIVFSDYFTVWLFPSADQFARASTLKGWLFVAVTSVLLYTLIRRQLRQVLAAENCEREFVELKSRRVDALLALSETTQQLSEHDFMQYGLELAEQITGSQIAFIHLVHEDQQTIELVTWSKATLANFCTAVFDSHYPISQAGIWADALHQRAPVVINDYASALGKHRLPEGHAHLDRLISIPVMYGGLVRMMVGVGNKLSPYTSTDVETVRLIADAVWHIVQRRRADEALLKSEHQLRLLTDNIREVVWTADLAGHYT